MQGNVFLSKKIYLDIAGHNATVYNTLQLSAIYASASITNKPPNYNFAFGASSVGNKRSLISPAASFK